MARGSVNRRRLMMLVRRNSYSVLTARNRVQIQQDAADFYPSLIEDMKAAQHSIHLQYHIWRGDTFMEHLKEILTANAGTGVEVRLLYDPIGSHADLTRAYIRGMQAAGVRMAPTSPLYRLHTIGYRNHRKITVIDGTIGYTGGMNIGQARARCRAALSDAGRDRSLHLPSHNGWRAPIARRGGEQNG